MGMWVSAYAGYGFRVPKESWQRMSASGEGHRLDPLIHEVNKSLGSDIGHLTAGPADGPDSLYLVAGDLADAGMGDLAESIRIYSPDECISMDLALMSVCELAGYGGVAEPGYFVVADVG